MPGASFPTAVRIGPADLSRRVRVRRVDPVGSRPADVVGVLSSWSARGLAVTDQEGRVVAVPLGSLLAGDVVPPEVGAYDAELLAETGWPAQDRERVGGWLARWDQGVTKRANSALVTGPVHDLPAQLDAVCEWYAARGSPAVLQLPEPWTADRELDALGWTADSPTDVLTSPTAALLADLPPGAVRVELADSPSPAWLAAVSLFTEREQRILAAILTRAPLVTFASAYAGDDLVGIGRASLDVGAGLRWACLTNLNTAPAARRRGVARAVAAALAGWAHGHGATVTYLQVEADNAPARRLYDSLGFACHHRYVYRFAPGRIEA